MVTIIMYMEKACCQNEMGSYRGLTQFPTLVAAGSGSGIAVEESTVN